MKPIPLGEANLVSAFNEFLANEVKRRFGNKAKYSRSDLSGKRDKTFADYFAGVNSKNILVEFKEFEIKSETRKPLRDKLCRQLPNNLHSTSYYCHFISHREPIPELNIRFNSYISSVCPLFGIDSHTEDHGSNSHSEFTNRLLNAEIGADILPFKTYIDFLAELAASSGSILGEENLTGVLISFNEDGSMIQTPFTSLQHLIRISNSIDIDPPDQSIHTGPEIPPPTPSQIHLPPEPRQDRGGPRIGRSY